MVGTQQRIFRSVADVQPQSHEKHSVAFFKKNAANLAVKNGSARHGENKIVWPLDPDGDPQFRKNHGQHSADGGGCGVTREGRDSRQPESRVYVAAW